MGETRYTTEEVFDALSLALNDNWVDDPDDLDWYEVQGALGYGGGTLGTKLGEFKGVAEDRVNDDIWFVFEVKDTGQLFKKSGYYASHYGTEWDGPLEEVRAVQRVVTFYE